MKALILIAVMFFAANVAGAEQIIKSTSEIICTSDGYNPTKWLRVGNQIDVKELNSSKATTCINDEGVIYQREGFEVGAPVKYANNYYLYEPLKEQPEAKAWVVNTKTMMTYKCHPDDKGVYPCEGIPIESDAEKWRELCEEYLTKSEKFSDFNHKEIDLKSKYANIATAYCLRALLEDK